MNGPRLEACYFNAGGDGRWERLARVLRATAHRHCPAWRISVRDVPASLIERGKRGEACNTAKLEHWNNLVQTSPDGDRLLLIDADTFVVRPLEDIWDRPFDFAYTKRLSMFPLNGGVVFCRVSAKVRDFFARWTTENRRLIETKSDQPQQWRRDYGGVNQASLAAILPEPIGLEVVALPCAEWNCEDTSWAGFDPAVTRIVHVKSALRVACLESQPIPAHLAELAKLWKSIDREARSREDAA